MIIMSSLLTDWATNFFKESLREKNLTDRNQHKKSTSISYCYHLAIKQLNQTNMRFVFQNINIAS